LQREIVICLDSGGIMAPMDPLRFPSAVPLVGEPCTTHQTWFLSAPITCNCPAKTSLVVYAGNNLPPAACPACRNVYGVVMIQGGGPKQVQFAIAVAVIGRLQENVSDRQVGDTLSTIAEKLN
jgi:hypothetical protein